MELTIAVDEKDLPYVKKALATTSKHFLRYDKDRAARFRGYADVVRRAYHDE